MMIDGSGFEKLADDIQAEAESLHGEVGQVVSKGAVNIKKQIRRDFSGSPHFKGVTNISYNRKVSANSIEAEIGPYVDSEGFGSLVGIAIHGDSRGGGGTVPDPLVALKAEEPRFMGALLDLAGAVLDE